MKNLMFTICIVFFFSCSDNSESKEDTNVSNKQAIELLAKKYNYKMTPLEKSNNHLMVNDIQQLEQSLKSINDNSKKTLISTVGIAEPQNAQDTLQILNKIEQTKLKIESSKDNLKESNSVQNGADDYQYSHTFYFNNTFPMPNLSVTISWNVSSAGLIIGASVTINTWGSSFGTVWNQTSYTLGFNGMHIWFTVQGEYKSSLGFGSWSLTTGNPVLVSGGMTLTMVRPGGAPLIGACSQRPVMQ